MLLPTLQLLRGSLGLWVPRAQHTLLRGQRGREQGHGLGCLALVAQCSGECVGYVEACGWSGPSVRWAWASVPRPSSSAAACWPVLVSSNVRLVAV